MAEAADPKKDQIDAALRDVNRTVKGQAIVNGEPIWAQRHQRAEQADKKTRQQRKKG